uniref:Ig-like domain-containing protein n=1 Tax=Gopherus agassizii TaxID=38772 RepID=A0A452GMU7_9SAUR
AASPLPALDCAGICLTARLLLPAELRYPKSNISLRPSGGVAQGEAVTIWCVCQCLGVRFLLRKGGAMAAHRTTAPAVDVVEFPICNVRRGDAGSYCCRYRTKWDPLISSEPSDPMELAGEGYPKPSISLRPSRRVTPGAAVTIRCRGRHQTTRFLLYNVGNPNMLQDMEPAGDLAEFPILGPAGLSEPSDPVKLVVALVLFLRGETTRLSWEGHKLPPAWGPQDQVPVLGAGNRHQPPQKQVCATQGATPRGNHEGLAGWDRGKIPTANAPSEHRLDSFHMRGGGHWTDARLAWWGQGLGELPPNAQPHPGWSHRLRRCRELQLPI